MQTIREYIKRSILGFLAIVLFSNMTFAFSIDVHYCQDQAKSVSYFGKTSSCHPKISAEQSTDCNKQAAFHSKSCCSNKQFSQDSSLEENAHLEFSIKKHVDDLIHLQPIKPTRDLTTEDESVHGEIPFPPILLWNQQRIAFQVFLI